MSGAILRPPGATSQVIVRVSPDAARLARDTDPLAPHEAGIPAVVADVEFGGTHLGVTVRTADDHRLHVRADLGRSDGFLTALTRGDRVVFVLDTAAAHYFDESGATRQPTELASVEVVA
jgi:iron(III) transport system ATP-binding protein